MKKLMAFSVAALAAWPASADNHQWGDYHWSTETTEVSLTLLYKFADPRWNEFHTRSISIWKDNAESPLNLSDGGESSATTPKKCDPIANRILVCSEKYGYRGWLGVASIWVDGNHITQSTVKYNDSYYSSGKYNTREQRNFVTCHEVGHTFGLGHLDENFDNDNLGSCMDYTSDPDGPPDNQVPGSMDWNVLNSNSMYGSGHDHSTTGGDDGGDGGGPGGGPPEGKGPNKLDPFRFRTVGEIPETSGEASTEWGRIVGYDNAGRPNEYLLDLGNGRRKITFVYWVRGYRPAGSRPG